MKRGGFTLIEVLVALVVAVAAMSLVSQGFTTGARASVGAQNTTRAALLAQRVITDFETGALPLSSSKQSGGFDDEPDFSFESTSATGAIAGLTQLEITIKWKEREQDRSFVVTRLMRDGSTTTSSTTPTTPK